MQKYVWARTQIFFQENLILIFLMTKKKKSELDYFFICINLYEKNKTKLQKFKNLFYQKFYEYEIILLKKEKMIYKSIFLLRFILTTFLKKIKIFYYLKLIKLYYQNIKKNEIFFDDLKSVILYKKNLNFIKKVLDFSQK